MTRDEYEAQRRRLEADAEDARNTLNRARVTYDTICNQLRALRIEWNEQEKQ
ncbi:hypothetical protein ACIQPQ_31235 [Streptomyces sp. NPDC091281]|uniref:hypothetical protein n=1 Tax=Streptomyces sp. NPDC091281 TaxID=3365985 RepID=UPI0038205C48